MQMLANVPFNLGGTALLISVVVTMDFWSQVQSHLMSHQYVAKQAVQIFKAQDKANNSNLVQIGGQILFNISKQALNPGQNFGAYGIAKSALVSLMRQISLEEGQNKIRCNGINADRIKTGLLNDEMIKKSPYKKNYMGFLS